MMFLRGRVLRVSSLALLGLFVSPATTRTLEEAAKDAHSVAGGQLLRREVESDASAMDGASAKYNDHMLEWRKHEAQLAAQKAMRQIQAGHSLHSKGMSCTSGGNVIWNGTDPTCRRRCDTTDGCKYFTTYRGDFCEIASSCANETKSSDPTAVTFATAAACDGILDILTCDMDAVYDEKCNNIEYPCKDGQRPCFKLYDHDRTGLVGHTGKKLSVILHLGTARRVTRLDTVGSFLNKFTMESSPDNKTWSPVQGSFHSNGFAQPVAGGVEAAHIRLTWEDSDDGSSFHPGAKAFLKGC